MQKSGLIIVILGLLIVTGLVVSIVGNQLTLEGINQGNGEVSSTQTVTISVDFDMEKTPIGIFAVQVMERLTFKIYRKMKFLIWIYPKLTFLAWSNFLVQDKKILKKLGLN